MGGREGGGKGREGREGGGREGGGGEKGERGGEGGSMCAFTYCICIPLGSNFS